MGPASGEMWGHHWMPPELPVDCLLPTGLIITLVVERDITLDGLKQLLWREARKYPLFAVLQAPHNYIFYAITVDGDSEAFYDETRRLCDLRLFLPILRVLEPEGNLEEKKLNYEIGLVIGHSVSELEDCRETEVIQFRRTMLQVCQQAVQLRIGIGSGLDLYLFPLDVTSASEFQTEKYTKDFMVCIWVSAESKAQKFTLKINPSSTPSALIAEAIRHKSRKFSVPQLDSDMIVQESSDTYLLKVAGCQLYMFQERPLVHYGYVRRCILERKIPQLMLMSKSAVFDNIPNCSFVMPNFMRRQNASVLSPSQSVDGAGVQTLWEVEGFFSVKVISASSVNVTDADQLSVFVGIYHGTERLYCKGTSSVPVKSPRWNEMVEFTELYLKDIPVATQICLSLCSKKSRQKEMLGLGWANLRIVDFNNHVISGHHSLRLWPYPKGFENTADGWLHPLGHNGSNPNRDAPRLEIEFESYEPQVVFPPLEQILEYAKFVKRDARLNDMPAKALSDVSDDDKLYVANLMQIDSLHSEVCFDEMELTEDEIEEKRVRRRARVWPLREYFRSVPNSLPRLLDVVCWKNRSHVSQLYALLEDWPLVTPEVALELLHIRYPDQRVRKFALKCLDEKLSDEQFHLYLIFLIQVLKYEPFLDNALTKFLLKRALLSQRIGHAFFWLIKSELGYSVNWMRYALILEAYCRGCGAYLKSLMRQVDGVDKLASLNALLKERRDDAVKLLNEKLEQPDCKEVLQDFESPIDNSLILGDLLRTHCRVVSSAKRPLWLAWVNPDPLAEVTCLTHEVLFKSGDDLRQDMLTMQVMRIMDLIWKHEGFDFRLTPYICLSAGRDFGMIEIVKKSKTIFEIQCSQGRLSGPLSSQSLLKWIREHNSGDKFEQAIENFTLSCAGYCVATFVLGIKDRHQSNIMITEDGHIFHIDFGHFLGHYKKKFGINRERVPFVLTEDFIRVIGRGADYKSKEFVKFQELCCEAYRILHRHASLFITLFSMMVCMGIPELQKVEDVRYLRKTLGLETGKAVPSEDDAVRYFCLQLQEAYQSGWTMKVDWLFHFARHLK